jgi:quercetin dioxygenase-like cupin family protein
MSDVFYSVEGGNWEDLHNGQRRKIMHMDKLTIMIVRAAKGTVSDSEHAHTQEQAAVIVSGKIRMHVGSETKLLGAGDGYRVAPMVKHWIEALEDSVLIDYFSPRRDDLRAT